MRQLGPKPVGFAPKATFCPLQAGASHQCEPVTSSFNLLACFLASRKGTRMPTAKGVTVRIKGGEVKHWSGAAELQLTDASTCRARLCKGLIAGLTCPAQRRRSRST